jgi:hypothetical protein
MRIDYKPGNLAFLGLRANFILSCVKRHDVVFDPDDLPFPRNLDPMDEEIGRSKAKLYSEQPEVLAQGIGHLITATQAKYFEFSALDLRRLRDIYETFPGRNSEIGDLAWQLMAIVAGFPYLCDLLLHPDHNFLINFINNIPIESAIRACGRLARVSHHSRNSVIDYGALHQVEAHLGWADFDALCDFAKGLVYYDFDDPCHEPQVIAFLDRLVDIEAQRPDPEPRFMTVAVAVAKNCPGFNLSPFLGVIGRRFDFESAPWHARCASYLLYVLREATEKVRADFGGFWPILIRMLAVIPVDAILRTTSEALIPLVGCDVELFLADEHVGQVLDLIADAAFAVKCNLIAAVAAAFVECSLGQFRRMIVDHDLGALLVEYLPAAGVECYYFGVILHGLAAYLAKMEVMPNRADVFREQFLASQDFAAWMAEMEADDIALRKDAVAEKWTAFYATISAIRAAAQDDE